MVHFEMKLWKIEFGQLKHKKAKYKNDLGESKAICTLFNNMRSCISCSFISFSFLLHSLLFFHSIVFITVLHFVTLGSFIFIYSILCFMFCSIFGTKNECVSLLVRLSAAICDKWCSVMMTTTMTVLQLKGRVLWVVEHRFVGYGGANVLVFLVGWVSEPTVRVCACIWLSCDSKFMCHANGKIYEMRTARKCERFTVYLFSLKKWVRGRPMGAPKQLTSKRNQSTSHIECRWSHTFSQLWCVCVCIYSNPHGYYGWYEPSV